jgi:hypothetical protein
VNKTLSLRFRKWAGPLRENERSFFTKLFEIASGCNIEIVDSLAGLVDVEIESVYGERMIPSKSSRLYRFVHSYLPSGIRFDSGKHTPNQQPSGTGRVKIFFTGENERPPEGRWDAYLTFDQHSYGGRNAYLPLWWLTSSDLVVPQVSPYLGRAITLEQMLSPRQANLTGRDKFCVAFIGKAYPFRMHALTALSKIGKVDVFGGVARNTIMTKADSKFEISQKYRFIFCHENDLFPGYVTEKAPEAWATGAVPLYWGSDPAGYLNEKALINLASFPTLEDYVDYIELVNNDENLWRSYAESPLLLKKPNIDQVVRVLKQALKPLGLD